MVVSKTVTALSIAVALVVIGGSGAYAAGKHKAAQPALSASAAMDALAVQHKDAGWSHNYQSWCDVDPSCNGWNEKMMAVEHKK
jgi:hypothetical protein